jgi:hypothetical protein
MKQNPCTFETSTGLVKKFEDISQTKGTPFVSGIKSNSTPKGRTEIVDGFSFSQKWIIIHHDTSSEQSSVLQ